MEEYIKEFDNLMLCCGVSEPEEQIIACYFGGLKHDIHVKVQSQPYITLNDVAMHSIKVQC